MAEDDEEDWEALRLGVLGPAESRVDEYESDEAWLDSVPPLERDMTALDETRRG